MLYFEDNHLRRNVSVASGPSGQPMAREKFVLVHDATFVCHFVPAMTQCVPSPAELAACGPVSLVSLRNTIWEFFVCKHTRYERVRLWAFLITRLLGGNVDINAKIGEYNLAETSIGYRPTLQSPQSEPSSYTRSQPAGEALLARAPKTVPPRAGCKMKPDGRSSHASSWRTSVHWLKV